MIKRLLCAILLVSTLPLTSLHANDIKKEFTLVGHLTGLPDGEIYLAYGTMATMKADTVIAKNGNFTFKGKISEPSYGMLFTHTYSVKVDLFVDHGTISLSGSMDSMYDVKVSGSPIVNEYNAYNQSLLDTRKPVQVIYEQWMNAYNAKDSVGAEKYKAAFNEARDKQMAATRKMQLDFIETHPASYTSAWELMHYVDGKTLENSKRLFAGLSKTIQESAQGKEIAARFATLDKTEVGMVAPNFEQKTPEGVSVQLAAYKGKYVLLEFWASWCGPCRAENPNLLKEYKVYKDKGFDVLAVSLDDKKDKWIEAIQKDGMPWTQVSDLKGWKNEVATLYGINAVPANFLIDPNGKIIARNLRGELLEAELKKIFPL